MRLTVELSGISKGDVELFKNMNSTTLSVTVKNCEGFAQITAFGTYDDLIPVIMQATCYNSYTIKLH